MHYLFEFIDNQSYRRSTQKRQIRKEKQREPNNERSGRLQEVEALIKTVDETILPEVQAKVEALGSSLAELANSPIYDKMCKKYGLTRKEYDDAELLYYYSSRLTSDEKAAMRRHGVLEQAFIQNT